MSKLCAENRIKNKCINAFWIEDFALTLRSQTP